MIWPVTRPPETLAERLAAAERQRQGQHRQRRRRLFERLPGQRVRTAQGTLHDFSSNDYLDLAHGPAAGAAGSGASALVSGYGPAHAALEEALAAWLQREAVLLTTSGFMANLAVATSLSQRDDLIVQDRLCHASLIDAARLSGARLRRFPHADLAAAERQLARDRGGHRLLVSDGVFSMDGDLAPVAGLARLAAAQGATLVIDDAHGLGVLGADGGGICELAGLTAKEVPVLVGTLGKSFGVGGAFIAGDRTLIRHLENTARSIIYSTALAPVLASTALQRLEAVRAPERRQRLRSMVSYFRRRATELAIPLLPSETPIQPLVLGDETRTLAVAQALEQAGYLVGAIRPPTVPEHTSRLRITLSAGHSEACIDGLLTALRQALDDLPPVNDSA